jgi:hypothetical protein
MPYNIIMAYIERQGVNEGSTSARRGFLVVTGVSLSALIYLSVRKELGLNATEFTGSKRLPEKVNYDAITWPGGKHLETRTFTANQWPNIRRWETPIVKYSNVFDFNPLLASAIMLGENPLGDPEAISNSGAVGLMQVMPRDGIAANLMCQNGPCFSDRPTTSQLKNPDFNIKTGLSILRGYYNYFKTIPDALMTYGPNDIGYEYADMILWLYKHLSL